MSFFMGFVIGFAIVLLGFAVLVVVATCRASSERERLLEGLPEMRGSKPCRACGSTDYQAWRQADGTHWLHADPIECNCCPGSSFADLSKIDLQQFTAKMTAPADAGKPGQKGQNREEIV